MNRICLFLTICLLSAFFIGCSDDGSFSSSQSARLTFSADTVSLDTLFAKIPSSTYSFWAHNNSNDVIRCENVRLENGNQSGFRVNVDGEYLGQTSGYRVSNVEIHRGDSLRVFVELTAPESGFSDPQQVTDNIVFTLKGGIEQKVLLKAYAWDATLLQNLHIMSDTVIDSPTKPVVVYGGITVDSMATLRISAGTTLYFHADAGIDVYGRLLCDGEAGHNVVLRGDRSDRMFAYLPYDNVSGQWKGLRFYRQSYGNELTYTDLHGAYNGIVCDSADVSRAKLTLMCSTVHNSQGYGILLINCSTIARNCLFSNALNDCVAVYGGSVVLQHCTLAQFYPFNANRGAALSYANSLDGQPLPLLRMDCLNSIVTGYADDVITSTPHYNDSDTVLNYAFVNSLLRTPALEQTNERVRDVIFEPAADTDSIGRNNFRLVDANTQTYDFHLAKTSKAIDAGSYEHALKTDRDNSLRDAKPDLGCYEYHSE